MITTADLVRKATRAVWANKYRPSNRHGRPGGLIDLSGQRRELIVVGDLHGAHENLTRILEHDGNELRVKAGQAFLVILGDGPHNDQTGHMKEMESSLLVMDEVVRLLLDYGSSVIYIRGNHDTFDARLSKSGVKQGLEFWNHTVATRGEEYAKTLEEFFDALPYVVLGRDYLIVHAGPVRNGCLKQEIIDIEDNPDYQHQLMWNRIHEFRGGTPSMKEYDQADIEKMLSRIGLPENAHFIVGHNPMWHTGIRTGVWKDVCGIKNHTILYTNLATEGTYLVLNDGLMEEKYGARREATTTYYGR